MPWSVVNDLPVHKHTNVATQQWTSVSDPVVLLCIRGCFKDYSLVAVSAGTVEHDDVATMFYQTMADLDAVILQVHRLQNPVLWQFYAMSVYYQSATSC